jgi:glycosyltransferase involved in cell wall biosynthesis
VPEPIVVRNIPEREAGAGVEGSAAEPERLVVYVGGLQPNRGIEQAIRALALLDDVRLRLLGPGAPTYRATLRELVRSLGVGELVEFAEPVPPDAVVEAVAGAGAGLALFEPVCLSHRLVLPNKLFEYARAGVPILGSDLPMIARFIEEHRIGMTVDPEDVLAIARAIDAMLEPERNRALRAAAASAREALDPEGELDLLRGVYRDVLGSVRGRLAAA